VSGEDLNKTPPCNPNPTDVGVISMIVSHPQSEHLSFNTIADFSGLASNIFLNISIIMDYIFNDSHISFNILIILTFFVLLFHPTHFFSLPDLRSGI
jgi:hypothetical protein